MRSERYYRHWHTRLPTDELASTAQQDGFAQQGGFQQFGDVTSLVNALRNRSIYRYASLQLLSDLVEVTRTPKPDRMQKDFAQQPPPDPVLKGDYPLIDRAAQSSPVLFRSLRLQHSKKYARQREGTSVHRILLCQAGTLDAPVDALAHLLASAIAKNFHEPAFSVVTEDGKVRVYLWSRTGQPRRLAADSYGKLQTVLDGPIEGYVQPIPLAHMVVAAPDATGSLPADFDKPANRGHDHTRGYDRIIYLTRDYPARDRPTAELKRLVRLLNPMVMGGTEPRIPYFSSFVCTVTEAPSKAKFDTLSVDDEFQTPSNKRKLPHHWRLERDYCRMPFDFDVLRNAWSPSAKARPSTGRTTAESSTTRAERISALLKNSKFDAMAGRWARAATNRRVGVAMGGGGASAYRLAPILTGLRDHDIPIDLVSGVSGGALVGAYYCHGGRTGLERCIELGKGIGFQSLARGFFDGRFFKRLVDGDLGAVQITETQSRLVALTTVMFANGPPQSHVVTRGTLGDAVQVSGAAAVVFGPIDRGPASHGPLRFGDGAMSANVPARILRDCGADMIFALNCLAGPNQRNPFANTLLEPLQQAPIIGRLIDLWVSGSHLIQRIGRETDEDAHVYFEPDRQQMSLLESFCFTDARGIAERSGRTKGVTSCVESCEMMWTEFHTTNPEAHAGTRTHRR